MQSHLSSYPKAKDAEFSYSNERLPIQIKKQPIFQTATFCGICIDLAIDPYTLGCGHKWCAGCLMEYLSFDTNAAPKCPQPHCSRRISELELKWLGMFSLFGKEDNLQDEHGNNNVAESDKSSGSDSFPEKRIIQCYDEKGDDAIAKGYIYANAQGELSFADKKTDSAQDDNHNIMHSILMTDDADKLLETLKRKSSEISTPKLPKTHHHINENFSKFLFESKEQKIVDPKIDNYKHKATPYQISYSLIPQLSGKLISPIKYLAVGGKHVLKVERGLKFSTNLDLAMKVQIGTSKSTLLEGILDGKYEKADENQDITPKRKKTEMANQTISSIVPRSRHDITPEPAFKNNRGRASIQQAFEGGRSLLKSDNMKLELQNLELQIRHSDMQDVKLSIDTQWIETFQFEHQNDKTLIFVYDSKFKYVFVCLNAHKLIEDATKLLKTRVVVKRMQESKLSYCLDVIKNHGMAVQRSTRSSFNSPGKKDDRDLRNLITGSGRKFNPSGISERDPHSSKISQTLVLHNKCDKTHSASILQAFDRELPILIADSDNVKLKFGKNSRYLELFTDHQDVLFRTQRIDNFEFGHRDDRTLILVNSVNFKTVFVCSDASNLIKIASKILHSNVGPKRMQECGFAYCLDVIKSPDVGLRRRSISYEDISTPVFDSGETDVSVRMGLTNDFLLIPDDFNLNQDHIRIQQRIKNIERYPVPEWLLNHWKLAQCHYCLKKFKAISSLGQHQISGKRHKAYYCCGMTFKDDEDREAHSLTQDHEDYQAEFGQ